MRSTVRPLRLSCPEKCYVLIVAAVTAVTVFGDPTYTTEQSFNVGTSTNNGVSPLILTVIPSSQLTPSLDLLSRRRRRQPRAAQPVRLQDPVVLRRGRPVLRRRHGRRRAQQHGPQVRRAGCRLHRQQELDGLEATGLGSLVFGISISLQWLDLSVAYIAPSVFLCSKRWIMISACLMTVYTSSLIRKS